VVSTQSTTQDKGWFFFFFFFSLQVFWNFTSTMEAL
jgi:hypothetical protein